MAGHGRAGDVRPAVPPRGSGTPLTNVVYPHFDAPGGSKRMHRINDHTYKPGVRGTRPRRRTVRHPLAIARTRRASGFQPVPQSSWRRELKKRCRRWKDYFTRLRYASIPLSRKVISGRPLRSTDKMR